MKLPVICFLVDFSGGGQLVGWPVNQLFVCLVGGSVDWSVGQLVGQLVGRLVGWLVGQWVCWWVG